MPTFESPCPDCWEPVNYSNGRASSHDCVTDDNDNEEND